MHSLGSSYLIRQSQGAEQFAGATVRIRPKQADECTVDVRLTAYRTQELIDDDAEYLREYALKALSRFADDHGDLSDWDIEIYDFAYHPVDTSPRTTYVAVYNALVSAFSAWRIRMSEPTDSRG